MAWILRSSSSLLPHPPSIIQPALLQDNDFTWQRLAQSTTIIAGARCIPSPATMLDGRSNECSQAVAKHATQGHSSPLASPPARIRIALPGAVRIEQIRAAPIWPIITARAGNADPWHLYNLPVDPLVRARRKLSSPHIVLSGSVLAKLNVLLKEVRANDAQYLVRLYCSNLHKSLPRQLSIM